MQALKENSAKRVLEVTHQFHEQLSSVTAENEALKQHMSRLEADLKTAYRRLEVLQGRVSCA